MKPIYGVNEGWQIRTDFDGCGSGLGGAWSWALTAGIDEIVVSRDDGATWHPHR